MKMKIVQYGRKTMAFAAGSTELVSVSVTERSREGEDESTFLSRLLREYGHRQGTIELVIKNSQPDYAVITFKDQVGAAEQ